jgi:hypothetical protein
VACIYTKIVVFPYRITRGSRPSRASGLLSNGRNFAGGLLTVVAGKERVYFATTTENDNRTYTFTLDRYETNLLITCVRYLVKHIDPNDSNLMGGQMKASGTALLRKLIDQAGLLPQEGERDRRLSGVHSLRSRLALSQSATNVPV